MQDRYYVIAIIVILAICCLGGYVAVSGYINSNPPSLSFLTPGAPVTPIVVVVNTDTPAPVTAAAPAAKATNPAPVPSPLGAFQTIAAQGTAGPAAPTGTKAAAPSRQPVATPLPATAAAAASCDSFAYCPKGGLPDYTLGVGGNPCNPTYIWGRVVDKNGNGLANVRVRYKLTSSTEFSDTYTKSPPDPAGIYNFPAQSGSQWLVWIMDSGNQISPQVPITAQTYAGTGDCPTRLDFQQK